jgi:putative MATE family efflux protein
MTPPEVARPDSPRAVPFWQSVRESLRGSHQDFTTGPVGRAVLMLAVPMVLEMVMESIFAVTDVFFVSKLGADAVATVGLTESFLTIVYALAMGLGMGATAVVARRVGEKDTAGATRAGVQALLLAIVAGVLLGAVGASLAPRLLQLMGASPGVLDVGVGYARVMLGGQIVIILLFVANAIFRGAGDAAIAMRVLWLANGINIVLGPCLVFGVGPFPRLGVSGAAVGTTIGRGVGAAYALWRLTRPDARVRVGARALAIDGGVARQILRISSSATLQMVIGTASWVGLVRIMSTFGSVALAGYTVGLRIIVFAILPMVGMSNAAATMVGQSLGARDPERAEAAVWVAGKYAAIFLTAAGVLFELLAPAIVRQFTADAGVDAYATACLRIVAAGFVFYAYGMVFENAFNGAGDTRTPTLLNLAIFWLWEIPLGWVLARRLGWGPNGIFLAIAIAFSTLALASGVLFRKGRWKTVKV